MSDTSTLIEKIAKKPVLANVIKFFQQFQSKYCFVRNNGDVKTFRIKNYLAFKVYQDFHYKSDLYKVSFKEIKEGKENEAKKELKNLLSACENKRTLTTFLFKKSSTGPASNVLKYIFTIRCKAFEEIYEMILNYLEVNMLQTTHEYIQKKRLNITCLSIWCLTNDTISADFKKKCLNFEMSIFDSELKKLLTYDLSEVENQQEHDTETIINKNNRKNYIFDTIIKTFYEALKDAFKSIDVAKQFEHMKNNNSYFDQDYLSGLGLEEHFRNKNVNVTDDKIETIFVLRNYMICFIKLRCAQKMESSFVGLQNFDFDAYDILNDELEKRINKVCDGYTSSTKCFKPMTISSAESESSIESKSDNSDVETKDDVRDDERKDDERKDDDEISDQEENLGTTTVLKPRPPSESDASSAGDYSDNEREEEDDRSPPSSRFSRLNLKRSSPTPKEGGKKKVARYDDLPIFSKPQQRIPVDKQVTKKNPFNAYDPVGELERGFNENSTDGEETDSDKERIIYDDFNQEVQELTSDKRSNRYDNNKLSPTGFRSGNESRCKSALIHDIDVKYIKMKNVGEIDNDTKKKKYFYCSDTYSTCSEKQMKEHIKIIEISFSRKGKNIKAFVECYRKKDSNKKFHIIASLMKFEQESGNETMTWECDHEINKRVCTEIYENTNGFNFYDTENLINNARNDMKKASYHAKSHLLDKIKNFNLYLGFVYPVEKNVCVQVCFSTLLANLIYARNFQDKKLIGTVWLASTNESALYCYMKAFESCGFKFNGNHSYTHFHGIKFYLKYKVNGNIYLKFPQSDYYILENKKDILENCVESKLLKMLKEEETNWRCDPNILRIKNDRARMKILERLQEINPGNDINLLFQKFRENMKYTKKTFWEAIDATADALIQRVKDKIEEKKLAEEVSPGGEWYWYEPQRDPGYYQVEDTEFKKIIEKIRNDQDKELIEIVNKCEKEWQIKKMIKTSKKNNKTYFLINIDENSVAVFEQKYLTFNRSYPGHYSMHMAFEQEDCEIYPMKYS